MKIHRFYVGQTQLEDSLVIRDQGLTRQWVKVLRFQPGQHIQLFNADQIERRYQIIAVNNHAVELTVVSEVVASRPDRELYVLWSLLKSDHNDLVLQKCTELGASHFVPLISQRTIRRDYNVERGTKIVIEAAEQCGRVDVPIVHAPLTVEAALEKYKSQARLYACQQGSAAALQSDGSVGVLLGPEGGWAEPELELFSRLELPMIGLGLFTLRAETAAIVATAKLLT